MRQETWMLAAPQSVRTSIVASASEGQAGTPSFDSDHGPISHVSVSITTGSVRVEAHDRVDVELDVIALSGRPLVARLTGDTFRVSYDFTGVEGIVGRFSGLLDSDRAEIVLRVPRRASVRLTAARADLSVQDIEATIAATSADGSIEVLGSQGSATATTASGRVSITNHSGAASVKTVSGSVRIAGQLARAEVNTISGDTEFEVGSGACVLGAKTVSSRVSLRLPAETGADLKVRTVTGRVAFDGAELASGGFASMIEHAEQQATVFFSATTVSGDIAVSHSG
jgi:Putative adhesin